MPALKRDGSPNKSFKHGGKVNGKATHLYHVWRCMKSRCTYNKDRCFYLYGGRGISVFTIWLTDYTSFKNYVESIPNYSPDRQLDRIDNNGDYAPGNVRWATLLENAGNRRNNVHITHKGETKILAEWLRTLNIPDRSFHTLVNRGMSHVDILSKYEIGALYGYKAKGNNKRRIDRVQNGSQQICERP